MDLSAHYRSQLMRGAAEVKILAYIVISTPSSSRPRFLGIDRAEEPFASLAQRQMRNFVLAAHTLPNRAMVDS